MAKANSSLENIFNKNEEDSYLAYVSKNGVREDERYYDAITKADTDRIISSSDYGTRADSLHSYGLNFSGFEDYLKSNAENQYLKKSDAAERGRYTDEYKNKQGYLEYLSDYEKLQSSISESVIKDIASKRNFSFADALREAVRAGISKDLAYATASSAVKQAKENTLKQALSFAKINNLSAKKAKTYALSLGLDERYAERVYNAIANLTEAEKNFYSKMSANDYYQYIKSQTE